MLLKVSNVLQWKWTTFPLRFFLLYLTEHIHVAPIWVEFKINQRGFRVNISTIGVPTLPDWRSSCPCQHTMQQVGYTKPDIFMDLVRKMDMIMWFGPFHVCYTAPPCACAVPHWAVHWVGRNIAVLRAGSWGPHWGFLWGFFFNPLGETCKVWRRQKESYHLKQFHMCHCFDSFLSTNAFFGHGVMHKMSF